MRKTKCSWCGKPIEKEDPTKVCSTGELMHLGCATVADMDDEE